MGVREITSPVVMTLLDTHKPFFVSPVRKPNYRFGLAESCWILSGSDDAELIGRFNKRMLEFSDDGRTMWGAYGPRLIGQLDHVVSSLKRDPDSRQGVVTTWRPMLPPYRVWDCEYDSFDEAGLMAAQLNRPYSTELPGDKMIPPWDGASWRSKDVPCTVTWHFQLRRKKLHLTVLMRSNDVWLGLPYDILSFTTVQRVVASMIGVPPGKYHHVVSNLHLYDSNVEQALEVMLEEDSRLIPEMPTFTTDDSFRHGLFTHDNSRGVAQTFRSLINNRESHYMEPLMPFKAAIAREPERCPMYLEMQKAIHRAP